MKTVKKHSKQLVIGITAGQFDFMHAGHALMFKEAKAQCDYFVVLLQKDASVTPKEYRGKLKHKPIMTLKERKILLESVKYINKVIVYSGEEDLLERLSDIKTAQDAQGNKLIRFIGADWKGKKYTGKELKIKTVFNSRNHNYSTTNLLTKIKKIYAKNQSIYTKL